ncbi:hypothetical protein [Flavobacterium crassostreae]|uniref:Transmembrane protein n=1 Tax=Flavobacterium crassostreae TaxID=1763534 RepID=A0A1B9E3Z6_9FLAO|nr:hypothetical protein [Flavobacterium crassostreae]OCB76659.1 hypothetical protein LPBF_06920 [Flavobacterium crassostreae]
MKKILPLVSYVFHPVFIALYATLFYLFSNNSYFINPEKVFVLLQIVLLSVLVPILFFFVLRYSGKISSYMVPSVKERQIPLLLHSFIIILLLRRSITLERYPELHFFFLGALLSTLIALLLLFCRTKASLHMIGISGFSCFVLGLSLQDSGSYSLIMALLVLLNGAVASSRLVMHAHTPKELVLGVLIGVVPQVLLWYLWL